MSPGLAVWVNGKAYPARPILLASARENHPLKSWLMIQAMVQAMSDEEVVEFFLDQGFAAGYEA